MPEKTKKWNRLYGYEAEIFSYIKNSVGNAEIAQDLFQDVYLQALMNLDKLDSDRSLKNWLKTVARNRVINFFREHKRRQFKELDEEILTTEINEDDMRPLISRALESLSERQREVIRLREIEGMSYHELGRQFEISESAVTSLLKRARASMKRQILLQMLPEWFRKQSGDFDLDDLGRFINAFDHAENLFQSVEKRSQEFFHHIREDWNKWQRYFISENEVCELEKALGDQSGKKLLDLGSGTGTLANRFLQKGTNVVAVDLNQSMLQMSKIAIDSTKNNFFPLNADVRFLPMVDEHFDLIFFILVLHHISDPYKAISEASRVLKKDGKIVIIDFTRHRDHDMADLMRDLWLGFKLNTIQKWGNENKLTKVTQKVWKSDYNIEVFMHIYIK